MQRVGDHRATVRRREVLAAGGDGRRIGQPGRHHVRAGEIPAGRRVAEPRVERHRQRAGVHEKAVAAAQHGARIAARVPGDAETRLQRAQVGDPAAGLVAIGHLVVAQPRLDGERRQRLPGVLQVAAGDAAGERGARQPGRGAEQGGSVVVGVQAAAGHVGEGRQRQAPVGSAGLQLVIAARPGRQQGEAGLRLAPAALARGDRGVVDRADLRRLVDDPRGGEVAAGRPVGDPPLVVAELQLPDHPARQQGRQVALVDRRALALGRRRRRLDELAGIEVGPASARRSASSACPGSSRCAGGRRSASRSASASGLRAPPS